MAILILNTHISFEAKGQVSSTVWDRQKMGDLVENVGMCVYRSECRIWCLQISPSSFIYFFVNFTVSLTKTNLSFSETWNIPQFNCWIICGTLCMIWDSLLWDSTFTWIKNCFHATGAELSWGIQVELNLRIWVISETGSQIGNSKEGQHENAI